MTAENLARRFAVSAKVSPSARPEWEAWCAAQLRKWRRRVDRHAPTAPERALKMLVTAEAARLLGLDPEIVWGSSQERTPCIARNAIYLGLRRCDSKRFSFPTIGRIVGRDHTSVMSGCKSAEKLCAEWDPFEGIVSAITRIVMEID